MHNRHHSPDGQPTRDASELLPTLTIETPPSGRAMAGLNGGEPQAAPLNQTETTVSKIPHILPHERVFPIQIGSELFKLSGASLSSDGTLPSRATRTA